MAEEKIFSEVMESFNTYFRIMYSYQNTPRKYGTEDKLFISEAHIIQAIGENPGLSLNELAEKTFRSKSAMSIMVKSLVDKKIVKRKRDPEDNRRHIINLTSRGQIIFDYHDKLDAKNYREILDSLRDTVDIDLEDLNKFYEILINYNKILAKRVSKTPRKY